MLIIIVNVRCDISLVVDEKIRHLAT